MKKEVKEQIKKDCKEYNIPIYEVIGGETKRAKRIINFYLYQREKYILNYSLNDCYNSYSYAKQNAFDYCEAIADKVNAVSESTYTCILSYNQMQFTYLIIFKNDDKWHAVYITKSNNLFIYDISYLVENKLM